MAHINELLNGLKENKGMHRLDFGYERLNDSIMMSKKKIITISGDVASGKTSMALNIALNAAKNGSNILYFTNNCSYAMTRNVLAIETNIPVVNMFREQFSRKDLYCLSKALETLSKVNLTIEEYEVEKVDTAHIGECINKFISECDLKSNRIVFVDDFVFDKDFLNYLQESMKKYGFTLILVASIRNPKGIFYDEGKINSYLEVLSSCIIRLKMCNFIDSQNLYQELMVNVTNNVDNSIDAIRFNFNTRSFKISEVGLLDEINSGK